VKTDASHRPALALFPVQKGGGTSEKGNKGLRKKTDKGDPPRWGNGNNGQS